MGNAAPAGAADPVSAFLQSGSRFGEPVTLVFQPLPDRLVVLLEGGGQGAVEKVDGRALGIGLGSPSPHQRRHSPAQRAFLVQEFIEG